jgi:8-oxo-dGTP pyrophosphatase MutT (NUDIX family)
MSFTASTLQDLATSGDLPKRLAFALAEGCRGGDGRVRMSPELSYGRHAGPPPHTARQAAIMVLLFPRARRWHIPLTERPAALRHGGQISLPGGSIDAGETSRDAAIRELDEELGVDAPIEVLGRLADCYVFASDFVVTPWVAAVSDEPLWRPHDLEVQGVVELPVDWLLDARSVGEMTIERGPLSFRAPCIEVGTAKVWGATSVILAELVDVLKTVA